MGVKFNRDGIRDKALNQVDGLIVFALNLADNIVFTEDGKVLAFIQKNLHKGIYEITILSEDFAKLRKAFPDILFRAVGMFEGIVLDSWDHISIWDPNAEPDYIFVENLKDIKNTNLYNTVLARKVYDAKDKIDIVLLQIRHSINGTRQYTVHSHCRGDDSISCGHYFEGDLQAAFDYYNNQDPKTTPASNIFDEWKSQAQKDNNLDEYLYHLSMKEKPLPYGQWKMKYNELKTIQAREDYKNGDPLPGNMERRSIDLCNQLGY